MSYIACKARRRNSLRAFIVPIFKVHELRCGSRPRNPNAHLFPHTHTQTNHGAPAVHRGEKKCVLMGLLVVLLFYQGVSSKEGGGASVKVRKNDEIQWYIPHLSWAVGKSCPFKDVPARLLTITMGLLIHVPVPVTPSSYCILCDIRDIV